MKIAPSPVVALNRAIAVAQLRGPLNGLEAIDAVNDRDRLARYPFYYAARGELELRRKNKRDCARTLRDPRLPLARNPVEQRFLRNASTLAPAARSEGSRDSGVGKPAACEVSRHLGH